MLVDEQGGFVTQRRFPQLTRVRVRQSAHDAMVWLKVPGGDWQVLEPGQHSIDVQVWSDQVPARKSSPEPANAMSRYLGIPVRWVYMDLPGCRPVSRQWVNRSCPVSFADGFPFLVTTTGSLAQLERWSGRRLDVRRFRPGIVVECPEPFMEDAWASLHIGSITLRLVKPCTRCKVTTLDPDTGAPEPDQEPLRTLARYRSNPSGVIFGVNAVHEGTGTLNLGDRVTARSAAGDMT